MLYVTPAGNERYPGNPPDPFWDKLFERFRTLTVSSQEKLVDLSNMIDEAYQTDPKPHWLDVDERTKWKKNLFPLYYESMQQNSQVSFDYWKQKYTPEIRKKAQVPWSGRIWDGGELQKIWKAMQDDNEKELEALKQKCK